MIDATDHAILTILQQDARRPNAEIARQVAMPPSAALRVTADAPLPLRAPADARRG